MIDTYLGAIGCIFFTGMFSQWIAWKFKFPAIISLLGFGLLLGPALEIITPFETLGFGLNYFIEMSVSIILFDGALQLKKHEFKEVSVGLKRILTLGVLFNLLITFACAHFIMGVGYEVSFLFASILIVTGPTVILPALREKKLKRRVSSFLKWEGILTDPVGAMFAVLTYEIITLELMDSGSIALILTKSLATSLILSFTAAKCIKYFYNTNNIPEHLKLPGLFASVIVTFVLSDHIQAGSGLMTVTIFGLWMGNTNFNFIEELRSFKESITTLIISFVFIVLAASLRIEDFSMLRTEHYIFVIAITFGTRLLAIYLATIKAKIPIEETLLLGLYGPRGIVAAAISGIFGRELVQHGVMEAQFLAPITFMIIISTVVIHGLWLGPIAHKLKLDHQSSQGIVFLGTMPWVIELSIKLQSLGVPVMIASSSWYKLAPARKAGIHTYFGQVLADIETGKIDLLPYSYLFAFSENYSFNKMSCDKMAKVFGAHNVFHLPQNRQEHRDHMIVSKQNYCLWDDDSDLLFENMLRAYNRHWKFKDTKLTSNFTYDDFIIKNNRSIVTVVIRANGKIQIANDLKEKPKVGDRIISYGVDEGKTSGVVRLADLGYEIKKTGQ